MTVFLTLFMLQGCYKEFSTDVTFKNTIQKEDCNDDDPCSLDLKFIMVDLTCENGEIPEPEDIKVFFTASNEEIDDLSFTLISESLSIPIASDGHIDEIDFNGTYLVQKDRN